MKKTGAGRLLSFRYTINIPRIKVNSNKEVYKIITVYRQAGCGTKGIRAVKACIPFVICGNSGHFNPLFYAAFNAQNQ